LIGNGYCEGYRGLNVELLRAISHRDLNLKSPNNLKLVKQKSPSRPQLITFGWLILNLKLGEKLHISIIN
jgi:hypothetical protein